MVEIYIDQQKSSNNIETNIYIIYFLKTEVKNSKLKQSVKKTKIIFYTS